MWAVRRTDFKDKDHARTSERFAAWSMNWTLQVPRRGTLWLTGFDECRSSSTTHFPLDMAVTKLRSSTMSWHGVFHKSRVFDPTCLYEAKAKPMIQQKCLFDSSIVNYADVGNLYRTPIVIFLFLCGHAKARPYMVDAYSWNTIKKRVPMPNTFNPCNPWTIKRARMPFVQFA